MQSDPLLSVCIITYKHEAYIRQALESVCMQKMNFHCEIIIADDCSTDRTRSIILEYKDRFPGFVRFIFQEENVGAARNFRDLFAAAKGKYIAYLEGDDYWINENKLQMQVDLLEGDNEISLCFHNVNVVNDNSPVHPLYPDKNSFEPATVTTLENIIQRNYTPSSSTCFRNPGYNELPEWHSGLIFGDWPMFFDIALKGDFYYFKEVMGAYRIHQQGGYSGLGLSRREIGIIKVKEAIKRQLKLHNRNELLPVIKSSIWFNRKSFIKLWLRELLSKFKV